MARVSIHLHGITLDEEQARPALSYAAGVIAYTGSYQQKHAVLLIQRAEDDEVRPGEWEVPGGHVDPRETPAEGAIREFREEVGHQLDTKLLQQVEARLSPRGTVMYTTFSVMVDRFEPKLSHEHQAYQWADPDDLPSPIHPMAAKLIRRMFAQEMTDDAQGKSLQELYDELIEVILDAAQKANAEATHDEEFGHPFHGNQYVNGISGPKPTSATSKVPKHALHELLASGHPFSQEELMTIAGVSKEATFKAFIYYIKKGALAKGKGALNVQKLPDGQYQVVMPSGEPAPALPASVIEEAKQATQKAAGTAKKAKPTPAPQEPAKTAQEQVNATPGTIPKAQADKAYKAKLSAALGSLKQGLEELSPTGVKANVLNAIKQNDPVVGQHILAFKNAKAAAMAKWASDVQGVTNAPKKQELFKADSQLAYDLLSDAALDYALEAWKTNTAKEKAGSFTPSWEPAKPKEKVATIQSSAIKEPAHEPLPLEAKLAAVPYEQVVPKDHESISADDFGTKGKWKKGLTKLSSLLQAHSAASAAGNKMHVEETLRTRLKGSKAFQALKKRVGGAQEGIQSLESKLISSWASSSGDSNNLSCALQIATRDTFNMPHSHVETKALKSLQNSPDEASLYVTAAASLGVTIKKSEAPAIAAAFSDFVKAQYESTQEMFKDAGIKEVYLARGMRFHHYVDPKDGPAKIKFQPASSFSVNYPTASNFAGPTGTVFLTKVPASQVLSTYMTGFGCSSEHEVVLLAHENTHAFTVPKQQALGTKSSAGAHEYITSKLEK